MKSINIIRGAYGYRKDKQTSVTLIDKNSGSIDVSDEEAKRLVNLGIAEYAKAETVTEAEPEAEAEAEAEVEMATGHLDAESLEEYTVPELKDLAKKLGLKTGGTKDELIERITVAEVEYPVADDADTDEPPVLEAADPE